jgi:hypothetical protein
VQVQSLENRVAELSASHATREEVQALRASSSKLTKKINTLEMALAGMADSREYCKDKMDCFDGESMEHGYHIGNILKWMAI